MNKEKELQNRVNPVGNTAVTTLALKAASGLKRAGEVYMRLGFSNVPKSDDGPDNLTKLCFVAIHDMRHEAVDRMIEEAGMPYVLDLPRGYTHRALDMADAGRKYIGGDLPAVISDIKPVIEAMAKPEEAVAKMKEAMKKIHVWKLTFDAGLLSAAQSAASCENKEFAVTAKREESDFNIKLSGRVDTLTAPEFLKAWEAEGKESGISKVTIDCTDLQYISSAGLRVMMIIKKALPDSGLMLKGVKPEVREILETTGFIEFFELV